MNSYIEKVRSHNQSLPVQPIAMLKIYGCQQNLADGNRLRGLLVAMGYRMTDDLAEADLLVINTCAVREHAEKRVLGHLGGFLHQGKPGRRVVLCGCMAARPEIRKLIEKSYKQVDLTFPPSDIPKFPEYLHKLLQEGSRYFYDSPITSPIAEDLPIVRDLPDRAHVTIMTGCDNFCSYCIVPYVRGRERSRRPEDVLSEIKGLVEENCPEIWLLGQNVNSYAPNFPDLLREAGQFEGSYSLRFMTSHPKDAGEDLFYAMAQTARAAPFLHLPLQAGSDKILQAMNRGYTAKQYHEKITAARKHIPHLNLTSDILVGFPGETEQDFQETLDMVRKIRFNSLFTFIFSPRQGTPAAQLEQTTPASEIKDRFQRLLDLQREIEGR
ncbi:MAG: MiaB/RimO family radical SAM methylthiotransferase [Oscillospiraceae bacterium]|nr:MiaB/RimO family radical SAM methylthiotransferase [Oscillospiraceae bacterium]